MDIDFVWNETLADQVISETTRAMYGQADDIRRSAEQFIRQAEQHEQRASQLESSLPKWMYIERETASGDTETTRVIDTVATRAAEREVAEMRRQAQEVRRAAETLMQAADQLDRETRGLVNLIQQLQQEMQNLDGGCAIRIQAILDEIEAYTRRMEALRDSFGVSINSPLTNGPNTLDDILMAAITAINPQAAAALAGLQSVCASGLDPINLATGNFYYSKEDITIPGRYPLAFRRFYNAIGGFDCVLGPNWTHNFNIRLHNDGEQIRITFDDGHTETYQRQSENFYTSPIECKNTLMIPEDEEGGFVLLRQNMDHYRFSENGALLYIMDNNDNKVQFEYGPASQANQGNESSPNSEDNQEFHLTKAHTPSGSLHFTHNEKGLLTQVEDHTGRQVFFEYNPQDQLTKATHPSGATYQYGYTPQGLISSITNPLGITYVQNEYDNDGRTIRQQMADGGIAHIQYNDSNKSNTVTEQNGNKIEYYRDERYRTTRIAYEHFDERFTYDEHNNRTQYTDRNKNSWRYEYDLFNNVTKTIDPLGNVTEIEYNDFNKPTKFNNPNGGQVSLAYNNQGNVTSSTDPLGRKSHYAFDTHGKLTTLTLADNSQNTIEYDQRGNITSITDAQGATTHYEYNDLNLVTKTINAENHTTTYEYNTNGDITKTTNAQGNTRHYKYNASGNVTSITDFNGATIEYKYAQNSQVEEVTDRQGGVTKIIYDTMQNATSITNPNGETIYYEYDQYNRITRTTDEEGHATTYRHDPNGNVISVTSPEGAQIKITYDALNREKSIIEPDGTTTKLSYDQLGNITEVTDALGNTTKREYDLASQLTTITDPLGNQTKLTYTPLRQIETIENAKGHIQTYNYYPGGRLKSITMPAADENTPNAATQTYEYNKNGQVSKVTDAMGNTTTIIYDSLDRVIETINPLGHSKHFTYDAIGNITSTTDENGNTTQYKYSALGDVTEVIDAMGHSTKYSYDAVRRLTKLEQYRLIDDTLAASKGAEDAQSTTVAPSANPTQAAIPAQAREYQITTYKRNKKGEVIEVTSPLGDIVAYTYDKTGKVTSKLDEDGLTTLYDYNLAGNLAKVTYADGKTVALAYNPLKQLTEMRDWLGTTTVETDALGRAIKTTDHEGNQVGYEYNELGQRKKLIYPDGKVVAYEYNPSGRLDAVIAGRSSNAATPSTMAVSALPNAVAADNFPDAIAASANTPKAEVTRYIYNPAGRLTQRILPDNTKTDYQVNAMGALTSLAHSTGNNEILDQFRYTYDPAGNITQIEKHRTGIDADNGVFKYTYDPLNRLTQAVNVLPGPGHDAAGTEATTAAISQKTYNYDNLGNRISSVMGGIETRHSFNARNQLIRTQEIANTTSAANVASVSNIVNAPTRADSDIITDYQYDKRGNLTQLTQNGQLQSTYTYDATNMMIRALAQGKGTAEYTYNGFRARVKKLESLNPQTLVQPQNPGKPSVNIPDNTTPAPNIPGANIPDPSKEVRYILDMTRPYDNLLMTQGHNQQIQSFTWGNSLLSASVAGRAGRDDMHHTTTASASVASASVASATVTNSPVMGAPAASSIYYLHDHLGSPIRLLSNDASNTSALAYDEFGVQEIFPIQPTQAQTQPQQNPHVQTQSQQNPHAQTPSHLRTSPIFENPFGFTGYQLDDITNMHYAQARYYAATNGRFMAEDPIQDQLNWYGYCNANPMTSVDPTGLSPVDFMPCPFTGEFVYVGTSPTQSPDRPSTPTPTPDPGLQCQQQVMVAIVLGVRLLILCLGSVL